VALDGLLAASARNLSGSFAELGEQRFHALAALREHVGFALDLRGEDAHGSERSGHAGRSCRK
jgi:hypothetical protein